MVMRRRALARPPRGSCSRGNLRSVEDTLVGYFEDHAAHVAKKPSIGGVATLVSWLEAEPVGVLSDLELLDVREALASMTRHLEHVRKELEVRLRDRLSAGGPPLHIGEHAVRLSTRAGWAGAALERLARRYSIPFASLFQLRPRNIERVENACRAYGVPDAEVDECRETSEEMRFG
jgi:hypothetical protein